MSTYRWVALGIVILAIVVSGVAIWHSNKTAAAPALQLASDLYPLYSGLDWNSPMADSFTMGTTTYVGATATSSASASTMDPSSIFMPFENYYSQKLAAAGWSVADNFDADGPTGSLSGYQKGSETILVGYSINYETVTTGPLQCPCDVTLSLFSGQ